jgi:hypothetical protein
MPENPEKVTVVAYCAHVVFGAEKCLCYFVTAGGVKGENGELILRVKLLLFLELPLYFLTRTLVHWALSGESTAKTWRLLCQYSNSHQF